MRPEEVGPAPVIERPFAIPGMQHTSMAPAEIKSAFDVIDTNRHFAIDAADIRQMLQLAGETANEDEVHEMIRLIDRDASGQVSFPEFFDFFANPPPLFRNFDLGDSGEMPKQELDVKFIEEEEAEIARREAAREGTEDRVALMSEFTGDGMKPSEIKQFYQRFVEVDKDGSGMINYEEFLQVLDKDDSSMMQQVFKMFDQDGSGEISLKEFLVGISSYTTAEPKDKLKFAFMIFDEDGSGYLDREELIKILRANSPDTPSDAVLESRADLVYQSVKLPGDAQISYAKFMQICEKNPELLMPVYSTMTAAFKKD